ncbi:MAG: GGDEF domain-containing protein [Desulfovibrio sp.]|nr:GGDEF domain-containing protein [Desulfovibrio sp.]
MDGKWPLMVLLLRGVKDFHFLSEVQKSAMQTLMLDILRNKDFSDNNFLKVQGIFFDIVTQPLVDKIEEVSRETFALANDMTELFGRHKTEVANAANGVDADLSKGKNPAELLSSLRDTLKGVVAKMEEDAAFFEGLSHKDSLTGLANRRAFDEFLNMAISNWVTSKASVSLIMFDIDHFKKFNDTYGHLVGDQVLRTLAEQIKRIVAPLDNGNSNILGARYGGEEFAVILHGDIADRAVAIAEVIRKTVQKTTLLLRDKDEKVVHSGLRITISAGVATAWTGWGGVYQSNLIDSADKALYHAKHMGRNCTVRFDPNSAEGYILVT